ncbi:nitrate transporter [Thioclava sp. SK-1]|uniref:CmpA/NrtA family ABC transporter substrate-binding protein n=1 Tax=Thioclava sp. SK-1 TaxID=1889770 RepID=UPI000825CF69|nr:CmpA/NrtA family ABC transporter substrate-binding protein [Thioclava sp. SK-1]OCX65292.1 nitrate transporter [Thioclava sp. SK-1]
MKPAPLRLGYLPLVDAAPFLIAQSLGFAKREGISLELRPAASWSALRDMLAMGVVDGAQMLVPVPVASALGLGGMPARFEALQILNMNGNVIGVSQRLAARMQNDGYEFDFRDARKAGAALLRACGKTLRIGVPFPFSTHAELVDYWLTHLGLPLPENLEIRTVPPPLMPDALDAGEIDAFCVGEPWGSAAVDRGLAHLLLPGTAIWGFAPEKALTVRQGWAEDNPDIAGRLMRMIWRSCRWLGTDRNRELASDILSDKLPITAEVIDRAMTGRMLTSLQGQEQATSYMIEFFRGAATFPWRSQAAWIGMRLAQRHGLDPIISAQKAAATFRPDLYRFHLRGIGADLPGASGKVEGALSVPTAVASDQGKTILLPDRFYDGQVFDPDATNSG